MSSCALHTNSPIRDADTCCNMRCVQRVFAASVHNHADHPDIVTALHAPLDAGFGYCPLGRTVIVQRGRPCALRRLGTPVRGCVDDETVHLSARCADVCWTQPPPADNRSRDHLPSARVARALTGVPKRLRLLGRRGIAPRSTTVRGRTFAAGAAHRWRLPPSDLSPAGAVGKLGSCGKTRHAFADCFALLRSLVGAVAMLP